MKRIHLIGNGPSLNKVDVEKLKSQETISFNRAFIAYDDWGFDPTYYMAIDPVVIENTKEDIKRLMEESDIQRFLLPKKWKGEFGEHPKLTYIQFKKKLWPRGYYWGKSLNKMSIIANVGATAVPVLDVLGYNEVVVLGTDCNYVEQDIKDVKIEHNDDDADRRIVYKSDGDSDPNHFRADYFGKGTEYSKPQAGNHLKGWEYISRASKGRVDVKLCSPGSRLVGLFEAVVFEDTLT